MLIKCPFCLESIENLKHIITCKKNDKDSIKIIELEETRINMLESKCYDWKKIITTYKEAKECIENQEFIEIKIKKNEKLKSIIPP